jgi:hypothetical protein
VVTVATWLGAHPPPPTLERGEAAPARDGPYRAGAGPIVIRHVDRRALVRAPRSPAAQRWIRRGRWTGAGAWLAGATVLMAGLVSNAEPLIQLGLGTFTVGFYGFGISFLDERTPSVAPPACHLTLDPHRVQVSGAVTLEIALTEIRELDHHPSGELRVLCQRDRSGRWLPLWIGPAAERSWIARLVQVAIDDAHARA